ncbi:MAG: ribbon-helix-helix protein, CopG family [Bryobacterales bacterium]|nr:ribbon-helix-helix protein, CopG family [Bryobacterales bacterium]
MKTAISVEESLMRDVDAVARDLGLSRSGLISEALREYLRKRKADEIAAKLNEAYADGPDEAERRLVRRLKSKVPLKDRW